MSAPRVLYLNHTATISGGEHSLLELLSGLAEDTPRLLVCPSGELADRARAQGIAVAGLNSIDGSLRLHPLRTPAAVRDLALGGIRVRRIAARFGAELIHANSIRAGIVAAISRMLGGPPFVVHVRDCLPPSTISRATGRLLDSQASLLIFNSEYTRAHFAVPGRAPAAVVASPVDLKRFAPGLASVEIARRSLGLERGGPVLGVVGQITPWKGQLVAVRALAELMPEWPEAQLLIVGDIKFATASTRFDNRSYLAELEETIAALGVTDRVRFLGQRNDVPLLMRALDVLLVPSWEEPFGRTVIEAMASGTPVVATSVGGPAEIITPEETGLLADPHDPSGWADGVRWMLEDKRRAEAIAAQAQDAAATYALDHHVTRVLSAYRQALDNAAPTVSRR